MSDPAVRRQELGTRGYASLSLLALVAGAALVLYFACFQLLYPASGWDQAWLVYAGQRLLEGVPLYGSRLIETNPPLVVWFSVIPALLAKALALSPMLALKLVVLVMIGGSTAWCARLLRLAAPDTPAGLRLLLTVGIALVELSITKVDFAQREHLIVVLLTPYILAVSSRAIGKLSLPERCLLGVFAGIAICFKPFQIVVLIGLEILLALRQRSLRRIVSPEFLSVVLTCAAYVASTWLLTPLYFQQMVPLLRDTYWAFGRYSAARILTHEGARTLITLFLVAAAGWLVRRSLRMPMVTAAFLVCGLASALAFAVQHTGWAYQAFPEQAFLALGILVLVGDLCSVKAAWLFDRVRFTLPVVVLSVACAAAFVVRSSRHVDAYRTHMQASSMESQLSQYPAHTTVYVLSTGLEQYFTTVLERHLVWGSRFVHLWMLPAIVENESGRVEPTRPFKALSPARVAELSQIQRTETAADLQSWKPQVIFVQRCTPDAPCLGLEGRSFDLLAWFLREPAFAQEWADYRKEKALDGYDMYTRAVE